MGLFFCAKHMKTKVAIQGVKGSYHHEATDNYLKNEFELLECDTFKQLAKALAKGKVDKAVMAIENTIAGAILPNYALITKYGLKVVGEIYLSIQHQLMVKKGQNLEDITEVRSHQMALLQCDKYLEKFPNWKVVNDVDTALTAKDIVDQDLNHVAAIASRKAAEVYGLDILASSIQTYQDNFTRFFVLQREHNDYEDFNKVSMRFSVPHKSGALVDVLNQIAECGINMDKIQSVPIIDKPWEYSFHIDITFENKEQYYTLLGKIARKLTDLEILGEYKKGKE
ncbi:prephenate dehydratase [Algoriella xinjiangensis]|uniref:prephenate dehydratase n=2 Tax=Algoriella xinjiangensis TaxID=684065 RepID=A0A1I4XP67_9FLAO|nr:prephenate dehydratase [Algoriella xinjiangensis]VDH17738.1 P-protein [Algoriella xinjiangensis]